MGGQLNVMFLAAFVLYLSAVQVLGQLKPGGRNVCHQKVSYNAYENRQFTRIGYDNYRTCCKKFLGICTSRCTRYRRNVCHRKLSYNAYENRRFTRIGYDNYRTCCKKKWGVCLSRCTRYRSKIVTYYNSVLVVRYRDSYFCCAGWAAAGSECTKAICSPACQNGNCVSPNTCSCKAGFQGKLCESDIDECAKSPCHQICNNLPGSYVCACRKGFVHLSSNPREPSCQDVDECKTKPCNCAPGTPGCSATCQNVVGSFKCSCNAGFQLVGGLTCADINECASPATSGCAQKCLNTPGSFNCACNPGYVLAPDKKKCNDINECANLNGGCTQRCINQVGTYYCACDTGFELTADKRTCVDIDECSRNKPCDQAHGICENTRGSYVCKCKTGYALQADKKTCKDINECSSPSLNSCAHTCHNNDGSYYCTCKVGFRLAADKRGCDDIDECTEKSHTCQHNCHNNVGSYTCSCRPGYKLEADGRKCQALPCQSITQPRNGQMKCSGFVTDESCQFSCDEGFNLFGSSVRKCLPTAVWSGEKTVCEPKPCPKIQPPMHGSVLLPCIEEYNSTCLLKCSKGFYLHGDRSARCIVEKEKTRWDLHGSNCKAVEACVPNPCDHGGVCSALGIREYKCNCEGTGYTGSTCQVGLVLTPSYPQLNVNESSDTLYLRAKPDTEIKVAFIAENGAATFEPNEVIITKERGEGGFRLVAKKSGAFVIKYRVTGPDAPSFRQPKDDVLYAVVKRTISKPVSLKADFFETGCRTRSSGSCGSKSLQLSSTCNWGTETAGYVSVGDNSFKLPVSPVGMKTATAEGIFRGGLVNPSQEVSDFLNKQALSSCASWGKCKEYEFDIDAVNFVISNNLFSEGYYRNFMSLLPFWVQFSLNSASKSFNPRDIFSTVGKGDSLKGTGLCPSFQFIGNNIYSAFVPERQPILSLLGSTKSIKGKTGNCLVVDMCQNLAHFSLGNEGVQLTSDFSSLGLNFINATSHGFGFGSFGKKCVKFGTSAERCVNSNTYWKVTGSLTQGSSEIEYSGQADIELADLEQALLQRLGVQQKLLFSGKLKVQTQMQVLGSKLGIKTIDDDAQGYVQVGGSSSLCPLCNGNGVHLLLDAQKDVFQYDVSTLKLKPSSSHLRLSLLTDANGAKVVGIENLNKISLSLRLFGSLEQMFQSLKVAMGSGYVEDAKIIFERSAALLKVIGEATNVTLQAGADYAVVSKLIGKLKAANRDLLPALKNLEQRLGSDPAAVKVKGAMRFLLLRLNQVDTLAVLPNSDSATVKSQGTVIAFQGEFCVHQLCFSSQDVSIYDVADDVQSDSACKGCADANAGNIKTDSVLISALTTRDTVLGKKVRLAKGNKIILHASRKSNVVTGSFDGEINVFKRFYTATFTFTENTLTVSAKGVQVLPGLNFDILGSNDVRKVSWDDVIQNVNGKTPSGSAAVSNLQRLSQEYFVETGQTTQTRLKRSLERQQSAANAVNEQQKVINNAQMLLKNATEAHRMARLTYQRQLVLLNRTEIELQSYIKDIGPIFIEKSLDRVCKFKDCKESCVSVPICKVCQDPVKVDVDTLKCEPATEVIRTNVLESFKTKCELRKYVFIPVYTGSCAEDPGVAAARDRQLQQNLASTGAATGALIGSVIPGIGTVLGGVIGGVVGFIGGLFSSCDKSYEVYTKTWTVQVDCTRTRDVVKTVKRTFSECFYVKKNVQTGYDQPQQCNCTTNPCLTKRKDPACLIENSKCQELRGEFLKTSDKIPQKFTDTYNKAEQLKNNVRAAFVSVRKTEKEKIFYEDEYNRAVIFGKHKAEDAKIATQSQSNVASLLVTESCLSQRYEQSSNLSSHLVVDYLSFDSALPLIDNVQIDAHVKNLAKKTTGVISFVLQFEDRYLSFVAGAKKIVRRELCNAARRRRSIEQADHDDVAFTSWYIDRGQNASVVQKACVTFESTTGYVKHVFENLLDLSKDAIALRRKIDDSKRSLGSTSAFSSASGETNIIVSAQKEELLSIGNTLDIQETRTRAEEVQRLWKANSEVYTGLNNVSVCLNLEDCLQVTFDSLKKLPTMFRVPRNTYLAYVTRAERHAYQALKNTTSLVELVNVAMVVRETLAVLQRQSLLCSDAPKVCMDSEEKYIVKEGERISLSVKVQSLLPVQYVWKRGKQILEDETSSYLRLKASPGKGGFYTCTVVSLAGSTTTNGTLVVVEHAPKFTAEPNDTVYYNPSPKDYLTTFTCNVTAEPEAKIEWYYLPLTGPQLQKKISDEAGSILAFVAPLKRNAGYYFCRAQNKHGMIQSRKARLDVVDIALAKQKIVFSFKVSGPLQNLTNASFVSIEQKMTVDRQLTVTSKFERAEKDGILTFDIRITPNDTALNSSELLLASAAKARQALANSLSTLMVEILTSQSSILTADGFRLSVDNGTMKSEFFGNICKPGYSPKSDGFLCAECPSGTYEKESKCVPCKIGQYQPLTGQTKCSACEEGEVTERIGTTNPLSCVNPRESKLDMVFVLDTSQSVRHRDWKRMKSLVLRYTDYFAVNDSVRVGIISYGNRIFIDVDLGDYENMKTLIEEIELIDRKRGWTRTYDAMAEALEMFRAKGRKDSKKVVLIFSDGKATSSRGIAGFSLVREESFHLRADGIHVISVGIGHRPDRFELLAAASYPKETNTFMMDDSYAVLPNATADIVRDLYTGNCFKANGIDIGLLAEPFDRYDDLLKAEGFLKKMSAESYRTLNATVKVSMFNIFSPWGHPGYFQEYKSLYRLERHIELYLTRPFSFFETKEALKEVVNGRFDEWSGSFSRVKVLVLLTAEEANHRTLDFKRKYPDEDIKILNVVTRTRPAEKEATEKSVFHTSQAEDVLKFFSAALAKTYCEP